MSQKDEQLKNQYRVSEDGVEPLPTESSQPHASGTGSGEKKKLGILAVLLVVGVAIAAYQFLGGKSPKPAEAVTVSSLSPMSSASSTPVEVETVLAKLENGEADKGGDSLSVARVEQLVKEFDGYVLARQVPLDGLQCNPFEVAQSQEQTAAVEKAKAAEAEAEARKQALREAASKLVLGSVMVTPRRRWASISGTLCSVGDVVEGFQVQAIEPDRVVLVREGETVNLEMTPRGSKEP